MRCKAMLWGAAVAIALGSTAAMGNVVVVKSLGPSSKAYPPGKTAIRRKRKISLQGGDVVTLLGPGSAQTLRGPGSFAGQVAMDSAAASARPLRCAARRRSRQEPEHLGHRRDPERQDVRHQRRQVQLWRPDADSAVTVKIRSADGRAATSIGLRAMRSAAWPAALPIKSGAQYQLEWPDTGDKSSVTFVTVPNAPADLVGAAQVLIENGCQNQLDLLVESASKVGQ